MMKEILEKFKEIKKQVQELLFQQDLNKATKETFDWESAPLICEINGFRWVLGQEADKTMNWADAKAWCESVGGELPPREVLLMCHINEDIKPLFINDWYWSATEFEAELVWRHYFTSGHQNDSGKVNTYYVRAVKKVKI
jgi:hypothetical protein